MSTAPFSRMARFVPAFAAVLFISMFSPARAAAESVSILNVSPQGAVDPGMLVTFSAAASGFVDPAFVIGDSTGATTGAIDKAGFFMWTPTSKDAGMHTITVKVTDASGHAATAATSILVAAKEVVATNLLPGPVVAVRRPVTFTVTAPGFISPSYAAYDSYALTTLRADSIDATGKFSWVPTTDDLGEHAILVRAWDQYGHSAQTTVRVTVINPNVTISALSAGTVGAGQTVSFIAKAASLANPAFTVADIFAGATTLAPGAITSSGVFSWAPALADKGLHMILVTAADAAGNAASTTVPILVTATATAPAPTAPLPSTSVAASPVQTTAASAPAIAYRFTTYLASGTRGTAVTELQKRLTELGFYTGPVTGYFGTLTGVAVKRFQSARGVAPLGVVGPATRAALNK